MAMGLEDEVKKLMKQAAERSTPMLEGSVGNIHGDQVLTIPQHLQLIMGQLTGMKGAICLLAREIDQLRNV
jgi:hypothetical protein